MIIMWFGEIPTLGRKDIWWYVPQYWIASNTDNHLVWDKYVMWNLIFNVGLAYLFWPIVRNIYNIMSLIFLKHVVCSAPATLNI